MTNISGLQVDTLDRILNEQKPWNAMVTNGQEVLVIPQGRTLVSLEQFRDQPDRIKVSPVHITVQSFNDYVLKFKQTQTIIEGSLSNAKFTARIDYHDSEGNVEKAASWNTHNPILALNKTAEYLKIKSANCNPLGQIEFCQFLESLEHVIVNPDTAVITDMVLKFEETTTVKFQSKINRTNGNIVASFSEEEGGPTDSVKIPQEITFRVAPYEANEPIDVKAKVRYSSKGGDLKLWIDIPAFDKIEKDAFFAVAKSIEIGQPEHDATGNWTGAGSGFPGTGLKPFILA